MDDVVDAAGAVGENLNIDKMDQVQDTVTEINSNKTFDASNLTGLFFQVRKSTYLLLKCEHQIKFNFCFNIRKFPMRMKSILAPFYRLALYV